jgi:hypothetical protein
MLFELARELAEGGVELGFAEMKGPAKDKLEAYGILKRIGEDRFYSTVGGAVRAYVEEHRVHWVDWEERGILGDDAER